jgi:hypothetical protein
MFQKLFRSGTEGGTLRTLIGLHLDFRWWRWWCWGRQRRWHWWLSHCSRKVLSLAMSHPQLR